MASFWVVTKTVLGDFENFHFWSISAGSKLKKSHFWPKNGFWPRKNGPKMKIFKIPKYRFCNTPKWCHILIFNFPSVVDLYIFAILGENWAFFATKGDFLYFRNTPYHGFAHKMRTTDNWEVIEHILKTRDIGLSHIKRRKEIKYWALTLPPLYP